MSLRSVSYEIFGKVQGVFFRDNTVKKALELGLTGTVRNRQSGTVTGIIQGPAEAVEEMKKWLATIGSPASRIDDANFFDEKEITDSDFKDFKRLPTSD